jgi:demethylmenaquinone methyltransferase/2-methoxy-6-polyprenyl-1,4-benzoquinol methylase
VAEGQAFPKGTQPEGTTSEQDASQKVREMFTRIAPRYDLLNHLLSGQMDKKWRARTARELQPVLQRADAVVLDLCCGTGDLAFALARVARAQIIGGDFSHAMLVRAREKNAAGRHGARAVAFLEADALGLPFAGEVFDLVAMAFGFRNLANYEAGLREILRVLKPGGTLAILEFTEPEPGVIGELYRFYCRKILPVIGGAISSDAMAYRYLPQSVAQFFQPEEFVAQLQRAGYAETRYVLMSFGTVALHTAGKKRK